ncbi:MAG TPA: succinate dehydrogenase assembly factor 2 [Cellvibrionaceae bacterium]
MLELDLILLPFVDNGYPELDQADKERYWKLLSCEDQDMFAWFMQRQEPEDPDLQRIVQLVRTHAQTPDTQSP